MKLEASLRRLKRFRELGAEQPYIDNEITLAKRHWAAVPQSPPGVALVWPPDIHPLARELGFDPDTRSEAPPDPAIMAGIAAATRLRAKALAIQDAIESAGGVANLRVLVAAKTITLTGSATNEVAAEHAVAIAMRIDGEDCTIINQLVIG